MSQLLGWVDTLNDNSLCHGYYRTEQILTPKYLQLNQTLIHGTSATYFANKPTVLHHVHVKQQGREITANEAYGVVDKKTWRANKINLVGNVHLHEAGVLAIADSGQINIQKNTAQLNTVTYRLTQNLVNNQRLHTHATKIKEVEANGKKQYRITDLTARGEAEKITQSKPGVINLYDADYSTCPPNSSSWRVKGSRITLDKNEGVGTAVNSRLYVHGVPIFYFPYFNFPINLERKSGFLFPTFGHTGSGGYEFSLPYYWNIAPNYDATFTPFIYSDRGFQLNSLFRYLTWRRLGQLYFSILPNDKTFKTFKSNAGSDATFVNQPGYQRLEHSPNDRTFFSWQDQDIIDKNWTTLFNINYASDDYYFQDFAKTPNVLLQNQLLQLGKVNYDSAHWHVGALVQNYETLHPVNNSALIPDQYARFPQLDVNANYPQQNLLDYQFDGELVNFRYPIIANHYEANLPSVIGQRLDLKPSISLPLYSTYGHFVPEFEYDVTHYNLANRQPGRPNEVSRGTPILDIDSGLYFQRPLTAFGHDYYQTFEPRLFYLLVPNQSQNDLPVFDTSMSTFTYDSIFQTNRFTGIDRIGDADQLGYGINSRFINRDTGLDRFDAGIGQIVYFRDRKITIPGEVDPENPTNKFSPLVGQLRFQFFDHWFTTANAAWEPAGNYVNNASFAFQYIPDNQHVINVGYSFLRDGDPLPNVDPNNNDNNLNQINLSSAWKLNDRWALYDSINYNISHHYTQSYLYGISYNSCCWAIRFVSTKSFIGLDNDNNPRYDSGYALQFALKGLSNLGTSDSNTLLSGNIPGYQDQFGRDRFPAEQSLSNSVAS